MERQSHPQAPTLHWHSPAAHPSSSRWTRSTQGDVPALAALHPHSPEAKAPGGSLCQMPNLVQLGVIFANSHGTPPPPVLQPKGPQLLKTALQLGEVGKSIGTTPTRRCWRNYVSMAMPHYKAIWVFIGVF